MRALVVVPTLDEAGTITTLLDGILEHAPDRMEVLVVDDGSTDGTADLVADHPQAGRRVHLLQRGVRLGLGSAYRDGFAWGLERGFSALCEMDADLSHDPADLPRLLAELSRAHLVIGSRYVPGGSTVGWGLGRRILSRAGNLFVRTMTGLPIADSTAGFRCYRASTLRALGIQSMTSEGYSFQVEGAIRTWRAGYTIREVGVCFRERETGRSKMHRGIVEEAVRRVLAWAVEGPRTPPRRRELGPWPPTGAVHRDGHPPTV